MGTATVKAKARPTDLPWEYDATGKYYHSDGVIRRNGIVICHMTPSRISLPSTEETEANARFIVRAVNSHEALVEALRNILADCETAQERRKSADFDFATYHAIEYARAALQLAEDQKGGGL